VFGDSDSEDESNGANFSLAEGGSEDKKVWEEVKGISGLWLCRNFLSPEQQDGLLTAIEYEGWFKESSQNQGICAHVDLLRFEDGIAIVSLESSCIMHFTHQKAISKGAECTQESCDVIQNLVESKTDHNTDLASKIPVLLMPGDIILMSEEARYKWLHEINRKTGYQIWNGEEISQRRRISITLRRLCQTK